MSSFWLEAVIAAFQVPVSLSGLVNFLPQPLYFIWQIFTFYLADFQMVVILVGTNNHGDTPEQIADGLKAICTLVRDKLPRAFLILLVIISFIPLVRICFNSLCPCFRKQGCGSGFGIRVQGQKRRKLKKSLTGTFLRKSFLIKKKMSWLVQNFFCQCPNSFTEYD
jgi:hypothetical protein